MAFWSSKDLQPKRKFRWLLRWEPPNTADEVMTVAAKTAQKPNYELGSTTHKFMNHSFFFPNRVEWKPITITLVDHVGGGAESTINGTSDVLYNLLRESGYILPTEGDPIASCASAVTKTEAVGAMGGELTIVQLGANDKEELETWTLHNPWISAVTFGDLTYEDEGLVEVSITVVYDFARYTPDA